MDNPGRRIIYGKVDSEGLFAVPLSLGSTPEEIQQTETDWAKLRMRSARIANYADTTCGLPNTYDPTGAYLCGGRKDGASKPCNMFVIIGQTCVIVDPPKISNPHNYSCGVWETANTGDPEGRQPPSGRLDRASVSGGSTDSPLGFGCLRCEYGIDQNRWVDSEGRHRFCTKLGHSVEENSCCRYNDPVKDKQPKSTKEEPPKVKKHFIGKRMFGRK